MAGYLCASSNGSEDTWNDVGNYLIHPLIPSTNTTKRTRKRLHTYFQYYLTHWGLVTHICVVILTIIGSDNGLSPGRRQAIIWTIAGILLTAPLGTNFIEILIGIQTFSFKKMHLKMSSAKWRPFCPGLNVLMYKGISNILICMSYKCSRTVLIGVLMCPPAVLWKASNIVPSVLSIHSSGSPDYW